MRVFLAFPFTQLLNEEQQFDSDKKRFLLNIIQDLENNEFSVFSAQVREEFGEELMTADVATELDYMEMCGADLVVSFPGWKPISGGVHVELGWASALKKPIILYLHNEQEYTPMVTGLHKVTDVEYNRFGDEDLASIAENIISRVRAYEERHAPVRMV